MKTRKTQVFGLLSLAAFVLLGSLLFFSDEALVKDDEADALSATQVQTHRDDQSKVRVNYDEAQKTLYVRTNNYNAYFIFSDWYDTDLTKQEFFDVLAPYADTQVEVLSLYGIKITDADVSGLFSPLQNLKEIKQADPDLINFFPELDWSIVNDHTTGNGVIITSNTITNLFALQNPGDLESVSGLCFEQKITQAEGAFKGLSNMGTFTLNNSMDCTELVNGASMFENFALNHGPANDWIDSYISFPKYKQENCVLRNSSCMFKGCKGFKHLESRSGDLYAIGIDDAKEMFEDATSENMCIGFTNDQMTSEKIKSIFKGFDFCALTLYNETGGYTIPDDIGLNEPDARISDLFITADELPCDIDCTSPSKAVSCFNYALTAFPDVRTWVVKSK